MRLIVHFGIHRTGSTSIQENLGLNRQELMRHGYLYPEIGGKSNHVGLPWALNAGRITPEEVMADIDRQVTTGIHSIILSAEDFCILKDDAFLQRLSCAYELHGIVYLRRQDLWLESWYNQQIRVPWDRKFSGRSFEHFRRNIGDFYWIDYRVLLGRISRLISLERLYVNVLQKGDVEDSVDDFMRHCGIDMNWLKPVGKKNESLSSARIDILRRMNLIDLEPQRRWQLIGRLRKMDLVEDNGKSRFFTPGQRRKVIERFSKSNRYVARHYFKRELLFSEDVDIDALPAFVSDEKAYGEYIPLLSKEVAPT